MTMSERVLGVLGGGMVLAALVLLVAGGESDTGARPETFATPRLEMVQPREGDVIEGPLPVVFRVDGEMEIGPGGWGVGTHHLHLELDGVELMPAAADIERLGEGEYRWVLRTPAPGPHTLRLLWSGMDHRPLPGTATPPVRVEVR